MTDFGFQAELKYTPELDPGFRPIVMDNCEYEKAVAQSGDAAAVKIAVERSGGLVSGHRDPGCSAAGISRTIYGISIGW